MDSQVEKLDHLQNRVTIVEQKLLGYESLKRWLVGILAVLVATMVISHIRNNQDARMSALRLEQKMLVLEEKLSR